MSSSAGVDAILEQAHAIAMAAFNLELRARGAVIERRCQFSAYIDAYADVMRTHRDELKVAFPSAAWDNDATPLYCDSAVGIMGGVAFSLVAHAYGLHFRHSPSYTKTMEPFVRHMMRRAAPAFFAHHLALVSEDRQRFDRMTAFMERHGVAREGTPEPTDLWSICVTEEIERRRPRIHYEHSNVASMLEAPLSQGGANLPRVLQHAIGSYLTSEIGQHASKHVATRPLITAAEAAQRKADRAAARDGKRRVHDDDDDDDSRGKRAKH